MKNYQRWSHFLGKRATFYRHQSINKKDSLPRQINEN